VGCNESERDVHGWSRPAAMKPTIAPAETDTATMRWLLV
jgi:hypothetical protein